MSVIKGLKCENVLKYFEDLCAIPHGSGNISAIADYCEGFARKRNLWCHRDGLNNVIIKKNASPGYEKSPIVVIQGHLDMVCEKTEDKVIDFEKEPITLMYENGFLFADRTTLGGDDGIAVAYALAILDDDSLCHPAIEAVFTVDEETDMNGAKGIDTSLIEGRLLLNIDSESEGVFTVSSAGTNVVECSFARNVGVNDNVKYVVKISGLCGGHSGVEIHKGRANANSLMGRILYRLCEVTDINLISINGGAKDNAIAVMCKAEFAAPKEMENALEQQINILKKELDAEYNLVEDEITLDFECVDEDGIFAMDTADSKKIITFLYAAPGGVIAMSSEIEGLVKTSLNCGIVRTSDEKITASFLVRSSLESEMKCVSDKLIALANSLGGRGELLSASPAWEYKPDSELRDAFSKTYAEMFQKEPKIEAIHAGLECGIFSQRISGIDCISYGPDIFDIHTPLERMSVDSVERVWNLTLEVLKRLK